MLLQRRHRRIKMDRRSTLIAWLNDAHAMETQLMPVLQAQSEDPNTLPAARVRIADHLEETRMHAARIEQALALLGTSHSMVKTTTGGIMGIFQSVETAFFSDKRVKDALMDYGAEQFEVGAYFALITAAEELGEMQVADLCRQNLIEDQHMASWLQSQLPTVVRRTLDVAA
jgi:ferritin-like metal-binding protein YciE